MRLYKKLIPVEGFEYGALNCGLKENGTPDLMIIKADITCDAAAVFTRNLVVAEPVKISRQQMAGGRMRAVVVNAKNANACTGEAGKKAVERELKEVAETFDVAPGEVFVASTGVIGQPFPLDEVSSGIRALKGKLSPGKEAFERCAEAIRTTDTTAKFSSIQTEIRGRTVTLSGIAKGSGMIHPNMGTMLGFIFTDAHIDHHLLQTALLEATEDSFNMISVDGDTSTNDCVLIMASGRAGHARIETDDEDYHKLLAALKRIGKSLAYQIVLDGEGATKVIEYKVSGLKTREEARQILKTIATSLLVKTALFGKDPNWGRILAAAGRAGVAFNPAEANLFMGEDDRIQLLKNGQPLDNDLEKLEKIMAPREQFIHFSLGKGLAEAVGWGTDLSYDYVKINAEYTT